MKSSKSIEHQEVRQGDLVLHDFEGGNKLGDSLTLPAEAKNL